MSNLYERIHAKAVKILDERYGLKADLEEYTEHPLPKTDVTITANIDGSLAEYGNGLLDYTKQSIIEMCKEEFKITPTVYLKYTEPGGYTDDYETENYNNVVISIDPEGTEWGGREASSLIEDCISYAIEEYLDKELMPGDSAFLPDETDDQDINASQSIFREPSKLSVFLSAAENSTTNPIVKKEETTDGKPVINTNEKPKVDANGKPIKVDATGIPGTVDQTNVKEYLQKYESPGGLNKTDTLKLYSYLQKSGKLPSTYQQNYDMLVESGYLDEQGNIRHKSQWNR